MTHWQDEAERLLELARRAEPSAANAARIRGALRARYLADPTLFAAQATQAASSKLTLGTAIKAYAGKVLAPLGIGAALGGVTVGVASQTLNSPAAPAPGHGSAATSASAAIPARPRNPQEFVGAAEPPRTGGARAPEASPTPDKAAGKAGRIRAGASPAEPTPRRAEPDLSEQVTLLKRAQQHLHRGEWAACLGVVREIDERAPHGVFQEEVEATRAIARCMAQGPDANIAQQFTGRFPSSVHSARIQAACLNRVAKPQ